MVLAPLVRPVQTWGLHSMWTLFKIFIYFQLKDNCFTVLV